MFLLSWNTAGQERGFCLFAFVFVSAVVGRTLCLLAASEPQILLSFPLRSSQMLEATLSFLSCEPLQVCKDSF